jgi:hypothetical protein
MKTAIYIEDGVVQLVLTPETEFEKNTLNGLKSDMVDARIFSGTFYDCRGGWTRQTEFYPNHQDTQDQSLIIRATPKQSQPTQP